MYRKKMIEVALPLEAINKESAREKSIRHGHPSTLHLWWARRPLAACRAVLFASLVDDPDSDPAYANYDPATREHMAGEKRQQLFELIEELVKWDNSNNEQIINAARAEIARCVASRKIECGELKKDHKLPGGETVWDLVVKGHGDLRKLTAGLTKLPNPESVNAFLAEHAPPVLDPFCGGGSIPLEAQRLGLRAYGSDLNPVPVLITKALIEIPPKFANMPPVNPEAAELGTTGKKQGRFAVQRGWKGAEGLAADVRYYGQWMRDQAQRRIGHLYPKVKITAAVAKDRPDLKPYVGDDLTVIAWLWARTVASPDPACGGVHVPLVRSFWLATKKDKEAWVQPVIDRKNNTYWFDVHVGSSDDKAAVGAGTKMGRALFKCLLSGASISGAYVDAEANEGRMGSRLMAIVAEGERSRVYLPPDAQSLDMVLQQTERALAGSCIPSEPARGTFAGNAQGRIYGFKTFADYFTPRQLTALGTYSDLVGEARAKLLADARATGEGHWKAGRSSLPPQNTPGRVEDATLTRDISLNQGGTGPQAYADAVATYLAFARDKCTDYWNTIATWMPRGTVGHALSKQAIPMTWDYPEANPLADFHCAWHEAFEWVAKTIQEFPANPVGGEVIQRDAVTTLGDTRNALISTDPPYYDNIGYARRNSRRTC